MTVNIPIGSTRTPNRYNAPGTGKLLVYYECLRRQIDQLRIMVYCLSLAWLWTAHTEDTREVACPELIAEGAALALVAGGSNLELSGFEL